MTTQTAAGRSATAKRDSLAADLRAHVRGEIQFGAGDRALYSTDSSNYRQLPIGVVRPLDTDDLAETVRVCAEHDAPLTMRGGGTSLAGQATNRAASSTPASAQPTPAWPRNSNHSRGLRLSVWL